MILFSRKKRSAILVRAKAELLKPPVKLAMVLALSLNKLKKKLNSTNYKLTAVYISKMKVINHNSKILTGKMGVFKSVYSLKRMMFCKSIRIII